MPNISFSPKKTIYTFGSIGLIISLILSYYGLHISPVVPIALFLLFILIVRTDIYMLIVAFLVPLSVPISDIGGGIGMSLPTEPMIAILMLFTVLKLLGGYTFDWKFIKHPLSIAILFNLIWMLLASFNSVIFSNSIKYWLIRFMYVLTFYFLVGHLFKNPQYIIKLLWVLLISTFILVLYTNIRHAGEGFVRTHSYFISQPFFMDHGIYAAAVAMLFPAALFFIVNGYTLGLSRGLRLFMVFVFTFIVLGLVFSFTRAAWVSLVGTFAFFALMKLRVKFSYLLLGLLVGIFYIVGNWETLSFKLEGNKKGSDDDIEMHVKSISNISTDPSNMERVNRWHCALEMFKDKPLFGFGPATYTEVYGAYQKTSDLTIISTFSGDLGNAHSEYFAALSETGLPGLLSWLAIVGLSIFYGMQVFYRSFLIRDKKSGILVVIALLGLLSYFIHAFLNNYSEFDKIAVIMWSFLAIITALSIKTNQNQLENES